MLFSTRSSAAPNSNNCVAVRHKRPTQHPRAEARGELVVCLSLRRAPQGMDLLEGEAGGLGDLGRLQSHPKQIPRRLRPTELDALGSVPPRPDGP